MLEYYKMKVFFLYQKLKLKSKTLINSFNYNNVMNL